MARVALLLLLVLVAWAWSGVEAQGYWEVVVPDAGIASMHSAVTHYGNVVLLDRTNIGDSQLPLPPGVCRDNPLDRVRHIMSPPKLACIHPPPFASTSFWTPHTNLCCTCMSMLKSLHKLTGIQTSSEVHKSIVYLNGE